MRGGKNMPLICTWLLIIPVALITGLVILEEEEDSERKF